MPRWDFKCPNCGDVYEERYPSLAEAELLPPLCDCNGNFTDNPFVMQRQHSAPSAVIVNGYNAKNGYSR